MSEKFSQGDSVRVAVGAWEGEAGEVVEVEESESFPDKQICQVQLGEDSILLWYSNELERSNNTAI